MISDWWVLESILNVATSCATDWSGLVERIPFRAFPALAAFPLFLGVQRSNRVFRPWFSALDPKSLGRSGSIPVSCGHMVSRSIRKARTARVHARKLLMRRGLSRVFQRSIRDKTNRLIKLYLELGLAWPNALQAAVADLQQLSSCRNYELLSPA